MKKFILSIVVMALVASCGKDNKVDSSGAAASNPYTISNTLLAGNAQAQELASKIYNPTTGFGNGTVNNTTWNTLLTTYPSAVLRYTNGTVRNSDINITKKQNDLMTLINSAQSITVSGSIYYLTVSNVIYAIDTRYAIQMNPSGMKSGYQEVYFLDVI